MASLRNASLLVGLHGAGLMNVLFARLHAVLLEFATDDQNGVGKAVRMYRSAIQSLHGGYAAVHARRAAAKGFTLSAAQLADAAQCVEILEERRNASRCAELPYILAADVGHRWSCFPNDVGLRTRFMPPTRRSASSPTTRPQPTSTRQPGRGRM